MITNTKTGTPKNQPNAYLPILFSLLKLRLKYREFSSPVSVILENSVTAYRSHVSKPMSVLIWFICQAKPQNCRHNVLMNRNVISLLLARVVLLGCVTLSAHADALPPEWLRALNEAGIPLTDVAVVIQPVEASQPILAHRAGQPMNPASVMKLLTSLVALEKLGPVFVWKTEIWAAGEIRNRTLIGDLIIKGYGDPTLTLERMWLLQREIRARGIDAIQGDLILDTQYFALPELDAGALDGEPLAVYNALPGALLANYNATTVKLKPVNDTVQITPDLEMGGLAVVSRLAPDEGECGDWKDRLSPIKLDAVQNALIFEGRYARSCGEKQLHLNVFAPPRHFDLTFRALWKETGGTLTGSALMGTAPTDTPHWMSFASIPLAEALRNQNKYSNNLMTRNLFLTLGATQGGAPATLEKSTQAVRSWLTEKHIPAPELVLENGAGLSRTERISAQTLVRVLQAAYASPYFSEFESSLPIFGVDGTLRRRVAEPALKGQAHLKTGTLQDVRTLAGYVLNRDGKRMVFVMMINHPNAERAELAQHALLAWTYAYHPATAPARARRGKK